MLRVGLTGGIASGKTTVSDRWREHGAVIADADVLAREVVEPGTPGLAAVEERFGSGVLTADGALDRPALARIVFGDDEARRDLEAIIHPAVRRRAREIEAAAPADAVVVNVIPLLVETGQADDFDIVVVVDVPTEIQIERATRRDASSEDQARARIAAQASRDERLAVADEVVDNSGSREHLIAEADRVWERLRRR